MRSDYTPNGRHKDDPTNPESHWNDWTIDRDGNKLEECKRKNKYQDINESAYKIEQEINKVNEELIKCYKEISEGRFDTYSSKVKHLEGKKEGLKLALSIIK